MPKSKKSIKKFYWAFINVSVAPIRLQPNHRVEMVSQLLFGEWVQILQENRAGWAKIKSIHDSYMGWVTLSMLSEKYQGEQPVAATYLTAMPIQKLKWRGQQFLLSAGSSLPFYEPRFKKMLGEKAVLTGKIIDTKKQKCSVSTLKKMVHLWLNTPYLWGGRTTIGIDCSGFVQVVFKMLGVYLLRDADLQATQGKVVKNLASAAPGDLLFFNKGNKIIHVGIFYSTGKIIHTSGNVRIDDLTERGIFNSATGQQSHQLCMIRRVAKFS